MSSSDMISKLIKYYGDHPDDFSKALETIQLAFYDMADLAEDNMPDIDPDANDDEWFTHDSAMKSFKRAFKSLTESPQPKTLNEELLEFYKDHPDNFVDDIEQLDDLNGYLKNVGNGRRHLMGELDGLLKGYSPTDMMALAAYSWDEQGKAPFNPGRDYFYWNSYAGLVSTDSRYYPDYLSNGTVEEIINNATHLHLSKGAQEIINGHKN